MDQSVKDEIYAATKSRVEEWLAPRGGDLHTTCLYWAFFAIEECKKRGINACLQAGSCCWPRIKAEDVPNYPEDESTHFGYQWDDCNNLKAELLKTVATLRLPEIHVWVGIVETQELLDFSTGSLVTACRRIIGKDWPGEQPPAYFWGTQPPRGVHYRPSMSATVFAAKAYRVFMELVEHGFSITELSNGQAEEAQEAGQG